MPAPTASPYAGKDEDIVPVAGSAAPTAAPYKGKDEDIVPPEEKPGLASKAWDAAKPYLGNALPGAAAGAAAVAAAIAGKHYFPGSPIFNWTKAGTLKNWLKDLDKTIKIRDEKSGVDDMFSRYMAHTANAERPDQTFIDYLAGQGDPNVESFLAKTVRSSGQEAQFDRQQGAKAWDSSKRVLGSLAKNMGVPDKSLPDTMAELTAAKRANAAPLYDAAFQDPWNYGKDTRFLDFAGQKGNADVLNAALSNAEGAFKYDPSKQVPTGYALAGKRKDAWRYTVKADDVPDFLKIGEPVNGLQKFAAPTIEGLDKMKQALWTLARNRQAAGSGDWQNIDRVRRGLTDLLDQIGPPEYKAARSQYKGDAEMEEAAQTGAQLLKMKPGDAKAALDGMDPNERSAAAMGFYGAMRDLNNTKLLREYVNKPQQYGNQNQVLQYMFGGNGSGLNSFLNDLEVEHGIQAATKFGNQGTLNPEGAGPSEWLSVGMGPHLMPHIRGAILEHLKPGSAYNPRSPTSAIASRNAMEMITSPATQYPNSFGHPFWDDVRNMGSYGVMPAIKKIGMGAGLGAGLGAGYTAVGSPSFADIAGGMLSPEP